MRQLDDPFVGVPDPGKCMHTSFVATEQDEAVLVEVGEFLGSLARRDLNDRIRLGRGSKHLGRKERKRALTAQTSGRWASAITRRTADLFERGMENLLAVRDRDADVRTVVAFNAGTPTEALTRLACGHHWGTSFTARCALRERAARYWVGERLQRVRDATRSRPWHR